MQGFNDIESMSEDVIGVDEGAFCETTKRIVIISPFPAAIRSLVLALTIRCYDVLVFHHEHDPALSAIQSDVLIIDRTKAVAVESKISASRKAVLLLVGSAAEVVQDEHERLVWPSPIQTVLDKIENMAARLDAATSPGPDLLKYKDVAVDLKRVTVHKSGHKIDLTKTEFGLFKLLLSVGGAVLTRQEIMQELWGDQYFGGSNSVDVHIKSLRQKLDDDPKNPYYITTVRGVGYRIAD